MAEAAYGSNIINNPSAITNVAGWTCNDVTRSSQAINGIATSFAMNPLGFMQQTLTTTGTLCAIKIRFNTLLTSIISYADTSVKLLATLKFVATVTNSDSTITTEYRNYTVPVVFYSGTNIAIVEFAFTDATISSAILTLKAGNTLIYVNGINVFLKSSVPSLSDQIDSSYAYTLEKTGELYAKIADTDGNVATVTQTVNSLELRIQNAEGSVSSLTQTADDFTFAFRTIGVSGYSRTGQTIIDSNGIRIYNGGLWLYDDDNELCLSFDSSSRKYRFTGDVYVTGGSTTGRLFVDSSNEVTLANISGGSLRLSASHTDVMGDLALYGSISMHSGSITLSNGTLSASSVDTQTYYCDGNNGKSANLVIGPNNEVNIIFEGGIMTDVAYT